MIVHHRPMIEAVVWMFLELLLDEDLCLLDTIHACLRISENKKVFTRNHGFFAIFHGNAHGTELPAGASGLMYSIGFVAATGLLHAVGITIGLIQRWPKGKVAMRLGGAVVAGFGCYFFVGAVT